MMIEMVRLLQESDSTQWISSRVSHLELKNPSLEFALGRPYWHGKEQDW